jgi:hypothetical protein
MKKPKHLTPEMAAIWDELRPQVDEYISAIEFESLVTQVYRMRDAQKRIAEEGLVVEDAKGFAVPHPAIGVEKQAQSEIRTWFKHFAS